MKRKLSYILSSGLLFLSFNGFSQNLVSPEWTETCGSQNCIIPPKITCDANQNSILTGINHSTIEGKNISTSKINAAGNLVWEKEYHVGNNDYGIKSIVDQNNNIYTLGKVETTGGFKTVILKYDQNGVLLWNYTLSFASENFPKEILLGSNGFIYFASEYKNNSNNKKVYVGKISLSGNLQNYYTYSLGDNKIVSLDEKFGKILVGSQTNGVNNSYLTILTSNLYQQIRYNIDYSLVSAKYDNFGNIIFLCVNNSNNQKAHLFKVETTLQTAWEIELDKNSTFNSCESFKINNNNIYVMSMHNNGKELSMHKINSAGELLWKKPYYTSINQFSNPCFKVVNNDVICTANELTNTINKAVTYKIDQTGVLKWQNTQNSNYVGGVEVATNQSVLLATQKTNNALYQNNVTKLSQYNANDVADVSGVPASNLAYFQYVGQLKNTDGIPIKALEYYGINNDNGYYYFNNKIAFTHFSTDQDTTTLDTIKRWDFVFNGATNPRPTGFNNVDYFNNYYYTNLKRERVNAYKKLVYPNLYQNIDLEVGENRHGTVLFFVIKPNGSTNSIKIVKEGGTSSVDANGNLLTNINGHIQIFEKPIYYEIDTVLNDTIYTNCDYALTANNLSFVTNIPFNSSNRIKVIEMKEKGAPILTKSPSDNFNWCSYIRNPGIMALSGAISKIDHDDNNFTYYAGNVDANNHEAFPATVGAAFFLPLGMADITIMKLTDNVEIKWATYFGGTDIDYANAVSVSPSGANVFVAGTSFSTDFPASSTYVGSYQSNSLGKSFILELNPFGQPLWATKFELAGEGSYGIRDCQYVNGSLYVVGDREVTSPTTMPNDGVNYYSTDGVGFIGIFKAGGVYIHGTGFGGPLASNSHTKIYGIDYNGTDAIAITGSTTDPNFTVLNAPTGYGTYQTNSPGLTNAFISKISLNGNLDFSYYISSLANTVPGANNLSNSNTFYEVTGDRGNDIKFSPNGSSIYVVGELYGDSFTHKTSPNPNAYNQTTRSVVNLNPGQISGAGFIFKTRNNGLILSANYFSPSAQDFLYATSMRLQEIAFDANNNLYITGSQGLTECTNIETPAEYNIPTPNTQPLAFYQKTKTTNSALTGAYKINSNSFIVAFNSNDEYIWSTYISGYKQSVVKPLTVTNSNHLYFGGSSDVINQYIDDDFPTATNAEKDEIKIPYWEFDDSPSNTNDWYNPDGAGYSCEFAGRFDVTDVGNAGPVLGINPNQMFEFSVYPNPNTSNTLFVKGKNINKIEIFGLDGKLVVNLTSKNINLIHIGKLAKGIYVIKGYGNNKVYSTKFIKQ